MLETLTRGFDAARARLGGVRTLDEANVAAALAQVRRSLLEADVDPGVTRDFLEAVRARALGEKHATRVRDASGQLLKVTPGQHFIASCESELLALLGPARAELRAKSGVTSVLLLGLQGVGKTTLAAKLARKLAREGKRPLLVAADVERPAAALQLEQLGSAAGARVLRFEAGETPAEVCARAREFAAREGFFAVLYDSAGRRALDDALMRELEAVARATEPANTLLVCDALMGRDAVNVARDFAARIALDGLALTKLDGDARGGAALAMKAVTGVPIQFLSTGERLDRLEDFRPESLASRILGLGDVVGLVHDFEQVRGARDAERDAERMRQGQFTMEDLLSQLRTLQKMGPLKDLLAKLPLPAELRNAPGVAAVDERELVRTEAMIQSMTRAERRAPALIDSSRAERIARGSGSSAKLVLALKQRFAQMQKLMGPQGVLGGLSQAGGGAGLAGLGDLGGAGGNRQTRRTQIAQQRKQARNKRSLARSARRKGRRKK